jgi:UDP-N-acetylmuramoyl-L-alanyl-D-glutamate--2,6-diaminopimelate ligase
MRLSELARSVAGAHTGDDVEVSGIAVDSREVRPGDLFVAQRGASSDGLEFLEQARRRGAVALCADAAADGTPTIVVPDARAAVPRLAATLYGHPARELQLIGITGTLGKTSTALLVQSALEASGTGVGVIGSLGVRIHGRVRDTGMTTPDAPTIHRALRAMADAGVRLAALEVTSHALALGRVDGLTYALGVFTNLVLDEHLDFHRTPEDYLRTKLRFLDRLEPSAPLVYNRDDERVTAAVERHAAERPRPLVGVSLAGAPGAAMVLGGIRSDAAGSAFALEIVRPLVGLDGREVAPQTVPLVLPVFGFQQVANAALAAATALLAGASPRGVTEAVADAAPIHRRMELIRHSGSAILDDTSGNPRTLRAVFESIRAIPHAGLRIAFGIRGARGAEINRRLAATLAALVRAVESGRRVVVVVTASEDAAGPRDRVTPEERDAVERALSEGGVAYRYQPTLAAAVREALDGCAGDDLVLLLGAQGMDQAARLARECLEEGPRRLSP